MNKRVELAGSICKIAENGDISFVPASRDLIFLLLIVAGLFGIGVWIKNSRTIVAIILLLSLVLGLARWANQPKIRILPASCMVVWNRWFHKHQCPFRDVSRVNLSLDRREYAWSTHFVDRRKNIMEMNARLELILEEGPLVIGHISGENAEERAVILAQSIAKVIGVPVNNTGYISKYL